MKQRLLRITGIAVAFITISVSVGFGLFTIKTPKAYAAPGSCSSLLISTIFGQISPGSIGSIIATNLFSDEVPVRDRVAREGILVGASSAQAQAVQSWEECITNFIKERLRKMLLDMVVGQIIQWIQGGGSPKFVTDWKGFLGDAANIAAGQFAEELGLGFLCQPFAAQLKVAFGIGAGGGRSFSRQISCTLDQIVGNINNFYNDFSNGGWPAYLAMLEPQNNFYGAYLLSYVRLTSLTSAGQNAAQNEAIAGGGFLSTKECYEATGSQTRDIDGDGLFGDDPSSCVITTPGQTIGALTAKAVGSDIDYIMSARELEEYVGAIADALVNRLVLEGARGLAGLTTPSAPSGGAIPHGTTGNCAGLTGAALATCQSYLTTPTIPATTIPAAPTNLTAVASTTAVAVTLAWTDNATNETGYKVERSAGSSPTFTEITASVPANAVSYIDGGVVSGTIYDYRVRAFNASSNSPYSNIATVTAP